jgi:hypothetical protein
MYYPREGAGSPAIVCGADDPMSKSRVCNW